MMAAKVRVTAAALAVVAAVAGSGCGHEGTAPETESGDGRASAAAVGVGAPATTAATTTTTAAPTSDTEVEELVSGSNQYAGRHPPPIVAQLESATEGLLFLSESDYPFEVLYWTRAAQAGRSLSAESIAALVGHAGEPVEEQSLDFFFRGATSPEVGQSPAELETVRRYQDLVRVLRKKLSFIRVFRFGRIQIHSFVVGVTSSGAWAGLSTIQIET